MAISDATITIWAPTSKSYFTEVRTGYTFFSGDETPPSHVFNSIIKAINNKSFFTFGCHNNVRSLEMRNAICILCEKVSPELKETDSLTIPIIFEFSHIPPITMSTPLDSMTVFREALVQKKMLVKYQEQQLENVQY